MANIKAKGITARIDVDTVDARASISQLKRSIRQLNTRFKDTYRSQLMAGHAEDALKTKNRGAKEQYDALGDAIDKVRKALQKANDAGETGTHNYHHAQLDLQNLVEWRKRENYVMTHTNHLLILHNDALRDSIEKMKYHQKVGADLVAQYKAEGDQVRANNQLMENRKQKMEDLKNVTSEYSDTERRAKDAGINNPGFKDYDKIVEGAHRAKQAQAELKHEIIMDTSDLQTLDREANNDREISQTKIRTYNDESRSIKANAERVDDLKNKLRQLRSIKMETNKDYNAERFGGHGQEDQVDELRKKLYRLDEATASAKAKLNGLQSGLVNGKKYDDLYNQSTQSVVSSLKNLKANAEAGRKEYQLLNNNIQHEAGIYEIQKQKVERVAEANKTNNDQTGRASLAYQRENAKLQAMNATLARHKHRIDTLGSSYGSMTLRSVRSFDAMSNHINKLDHSAHGYLRTAHALTNGSIALGAAFIYGVKQAAGLENEFNKVKNLLNASHESMRQAGSEVKEMSQNATDLSMKYGENQKNIANGFESLVRRGYTGKQALASQKYYLQGTIASGDKYSDVMHTAASTLEAFNMRSSNTNKMVGNTKKVINQLAYASDLTATDMKGIGYGMQYVGGSAHNAHQSLSETASALGELSNRGENSTVAATGLRKILLSLATIKTGKNGKALKQLGLQPKDLMDASGNLKSLQDIFTLFRSKMKGMSSTQQASVFKSLFGTTGYNSAVDLMNSTNGLKKLNAQVAKSQDQAHGQGYAQQIARKNMNSTEMQFKRLTAAGQELAKDYAQGLNPVFKRFSDVALVAAKVVDGMPKPMKDLVTIGTALVPLFAGGTYAMATLKKASAVWINIQRQGWLGFLKLKSAVSSSSSTYDQHISQLNQTTAAQRELNEAKQQGSQAEQENIASTDRDTTSQYSNAQSSRVDAAADKIDMASKEGQDRINSSQIMLPHGVSEGEDANKGGRVSQFVSKIPHKGSIAAGALMGGTEAASGDVQGGVEDGVGTAAGMAVGTGVGGPIGGAIGSIAGPMLARYVGNAVSKAAKGNPIPHTTYEQQSHDHAFNHELSGISSSSRKFVRGEARLEQKALVGFASRGGKITSGVRKDINQIYQLSKSYGNKELRTKESNLKDLHKQGLISTKNYNKDLSNAKKSESKTVADIRKIHNRLLHSDRNNSTKRYHDEQRLNKDILKLTNAGANRQKKLVKQLMYGTTKLSEKSYSKVMRLRNRNYRDTVSKARSRYNLQKRTLNKELATASQYGRSTYNQAKRRANKKLSEDYKEYQGAKSSAEKERSSVTSAANKRASNEVKTNYEENKTIKNNNSNFIDDIKGMFSGMGSFISRIVSAEPKGRQPGGKTARALGTPDTQALHFATGSLPGISKDENSIINDGSGRELVKLPNGQMVLPSGRNVHTVLPKGTSVFNAMQTRKMLSMITPAIHHAAGTVGEASFAGGTGRGRKSTVNVKTPEGDLTNTAKKTKKTMKNIHDTLQNGYKKSSKDASKQLDKFHDHNSDSWDDTKDITKKHAKDIHDDTVSRYDKMRDDINDSMEKSNRWTNNRLDTTVSYFRHHFAMLPPITRSSMRSGVNNINAGIASIDRVLSEFGGNSHVLSAVHYATGTSGPSLQKQLAVLNDSHSGPRQEAIVSDQGKVRMPVGPNALTMLNPGDKVLNGSDTLRAMKSGLIPHYAKGKQSADALKSLAKHYAKTPSSFTSNTFNKLAAVIGNVLSKGITQSTKSGAQKPANNWSNAMWKYIDTLINPDNSALVKEMHALGDGKRYKWGGNGPSAYDCSGLVHAALSALHIGSPRLAGEFRNIGKVIPRSEAGPGDIVESSKHVGVVDSQGANSYFSAYNQSVHPNILSQPLDTAHFTPGHPFWFVRVPQLARDNGEVEQVKNNPLTPLVKRQLGHGSAKWIQSHLSDDLGSMGNPAGDSVTRWIPAIKKAADAMHADLTPRLESLLLGTMANESHGDPKIVGINDGDGTGNALGLLQYKRGSFGSYAVKGHDNIFNGYDQLLAYFNSSNYRNALVAHDTANGKNGGEWSPLHGSGPSGSRRYAHGGLSVADKMAHISEGNKPEMVLPLTNRSRAVELMLKSLQYMFGNNDQNNNNQQNNQRQNQVSNDQAMRDRRFEQELIQSNRNKDKLIDRILNKMTVLIQTVQNKPVISDADIYRGNRRVTMSKARLRNFNRGTF